MRSTFLVPCKWPRPSSSRTRTIPTPCWHSRSPIEPKSSSRRLESTMTPKSAWLSLNSFPTSFVRNAISLDDYSGLASKYDDELNKVWMTCRGFYRQESSSPFGGKEEKTRRTMIKAWTWVVQQVTIIIPFFISLAIFLGSATGHRIFILICVPSITILPLMKSEWLLAYKWKEGGFWRVSEVRRRATVIQTELVDQVDHRLRRRRFLLISGALFFLPFPVYSSRDSVLKPVIAFWLLIFFLHAIRPPCDPTFFLCLSVVEVFWCFEWACDLGGVMGTMEFRNVR